MIPFATFTNHDAWAVALVIGLSWRSRSPAC